MLVAKGTSVLSTRPHTITLPSLPGTPGKPEGPAWSATVPLPSGAMSRAPALTSNPTLTGIDCVVQSFGDGPGDLWHARFDGTTWGPFTRGPAGKTQHRPALAWFNNVLYCAFTQDDFTLYLSKLQGTTWTAPEVVSFGGVAAGTVRGAPALVNRGPNLCCAVTTISDQVRFGVFDGTRWSDRQRVSGPGAAPDPALMTGQGGNPLCVWRSKSNQIWASQYDGSAFWSDPVQLPGTAVSGPALGVNFGRPICVVRAKADSEQLYWSMRDDKGDGSWSPFTEVPNVSSADSPALANLHGIPGDTAAPYGRTVLLFRH